MSLISCVGARIPHGGCPSGPLWTERVAPSSKRWFALAFGSGGLVAAGGSDPGTTYPCAMYSTDYGYTWSTSPTSFASLAGYSFVLNCLAYGNGVFLAAINAVSMVRSLDGINWSVVPTPAIATIAKLEFGGGIFVAVRSSSSSIYTSPDGVTWSTRALPASDTWGGVGYGSNGTWIVTSNTNSARSVDGGVTWSAGGALGSPSGGCNTLAYGNGVWIGTANLNENRVRYSLDDGLTWGMTAPLTVVGSLVFERVRFIGGIFYVASVGGLNCFKSSDGINWTSANPLVNMSSFSVEWGSNNASPYRYAAVGNAGSSTIVTNYGVCG